MDLTFLDMTPTATFLSRYRLYLQLFPQCPKMNKNPMWEVKKKFKISVHGTWNPATLWLQGARNYDRYMQTCSLRNPVGPFKPYLAEETSLQSSNCNVMGHAATLVFFTHGSLIYPDLGVLPGMLPPKRSR